MYTLLYIGKHEKEKKKWSYKDEHTWDKNGNNKKFDTKSLTLRVKNNIVLTITAYIL